MTTGPCRTLVSPGSPQLVCSMRHGGLCEADPFCTQVRNAVRNLHAILKCRHGITSKAKLPAFVLLGGSDCADATMEPHLITDMFGKGDLQIPHRLNAVRGRDGVFELAPSDLNTYSITTTHRVLRRVLLSAAGETGTDSRSIEALSVRGF